ncbi:type IV pilus biogenesis and competence protein PilQ precursor [mine drainage metagenome]|uniref:Type IV pilus biogenesis and competence protein PilQ n=1 Tax=mine drainage metagenome TaxID=410659 RepID=A0A1J5QK21_9ZZZZ
MGNLFKQIGIVTLSCLILTAGLVAQAADADPSRIESIDFFSLAGGKVNIKLTLSQPVGNAPAGFALNNPPRIALDFPNVVNGTKKSSYAVDQLMLRSVSLAQGKDRTRVVLNLSRVSAYTTSVNGKEVSILLQPQDGVRQAQGNVTKFAEPVLTDQSHALNGIDFMRGKNGEGRVVVDLSDVGTGIDMRRQGKNIIIDFINTDIPARLERRLNVVNFNTPVLNVDAMKQGRNARLVIEPKGDWEQSSYQTDKKFIVDIKPIVEDPNKLVQGSRTGYTGDKLSLNFQNIEVRAVLQVIADFTGFNILTSDTVSGNLTLRLKDVPWDQAMDIIMESKGLAMRKTGNVIWVAPSEELAAKEKLKLEALQQIDDLEAMHTEVFKLKYEKADAFKAIISDPKQKILSKRGTAVTDARTNTLFVQDTSKHLEDVQRLLNVVDVPVRQVLIESRIVIADESLARSLGAKFGIQKKGGTVSMAGTTTQAQALTNVQGGANAALGNASGDLMANMPATGDGLGQIGVSVFSAPLGALINLEISASEAENKSKTISSPRVITADQKKATIDSGVEIPYQQASSSGATNVAFQDANLTLDVTPHITPDDRISMELAVHKDSVGSVFNGVPSINTRKVKTEVMVGNGETAVLGGIYEETTSKTTNKVPFFGDLPVLGYLFKQTADSVTKEELLIFITPKIMRDLL